MIMLASGSSPAARAFPARVLPRARHALLAVGLVEVFHALQLRGSADLGLKLGRKLAGRVDEGDDVFLALLEVAQVPEPLVERAQGHVVHAAGSLFAVAGNEGDGVALVDELNGGLNRGGLEAELGCKGCDDVHKQAPQVGNTNA